MLFSSPLQYHHSNTLMVISLFFSCFVFYISIKYKFISYESVLWKCRCTTLHPFSTIIRYKLYFILSMLRVLIFTPVNFHRICFTQIVFEVFLLFNLYLSSKGTYIHGITSFSFHLIFTVISLLFQVLYHKVQMHLFLYLAYLLFLLQL